MKCPYYHQACASGAVPLVPGNHGPLRAQRKGLDYCATDRHRWCLLYRNAGRELALAAQQEAACAIG